MGTRLLRRRCRPGPADVPVPLGQKASFGGSFQPRSGLPMEKRCGITNKVPEVL